MPCKLVAGVDSFDAGEQVHIAGVEGVHPQPMQISPVGERGD